MDSMLKSGCFIQKESNISRMFQTSSMQWHFQSFDTSSCYSHMITKNNWKKIKHLADTTLYHSAKEDVQLIDIHWMYTEQFFPVLNQNDRTENENKNTFLRLTTMVRISILFRSNHFQYLKDEYLRRMRHVSCTYSWLCTERIKMNHYQ